MYGLLYVVNLKQLSVSHGFCLKDKVARFAGAELPATTRVPGGG